MANVHPNLQHCFIIERLDVQLPFQQNTDTWMHENRSSANIWTQTSVFFKNTFYRSFCPSWHRDM